MWRNESFQFYLLRVGDDTVLYCFEVINQSWASFEFLSFSLTAINFHKLLRALIGYWLIDRFDWYSQMIKLMVHLVIISVSIKLVFISINKYTIVIRFLQ